MRYRLLAAAVTLVVGASSQARATQADVLNFQYTLADGNVLAASLDGTLQADGNTFEVSGYNSIYYDGTVLVINPTSFESYSNYVEYSQSVNATGVLTLDGSYEDFIDYNSNTSTGFDLIVNAGFGYSNGADIGTFGFSPLHDQPFAALNFVATVNAAAAPEPATVTLLGAGLAGLAGLRHRRRG